jgi:hypothetical protein
MQTAAPECVPLATPCPRTIVDLPDSFSARAILDGAADNHTNS